MAPLESLGRWLLVAGIALAALGAVFLVASRLGLTRLPGDVVVRRGSWTFYAPFGLMIALSLLLTLLLNAFGRK